MKDELRVIPKKNYIILGIVIGTIITTICNIVNKKTDEKQYLEEYKEIIRKCLKYEDNNSKNKNPYVLFATRIWNLICN